MKSLPWGRQSNFSKWDLPPPDFLKTLMWMAALGSRGYAIKNGVSWGKMHICQKCYDASLLRCEARVYQESMPTWTPLGAPRWPRNAQMEPINWNPNRTQMQSNSNPNRNGNQRESKWNPTGTQLESKWDPKGIQMDSTWNPTLRMESKWNPAGTQLESKWDQKGFKWTPHGPQQSEWNPNGIQMEFKPFGPLQT